MMKRSKLQNSKGMATIEALPLIVIFLVLVSYGLGLFGAIHAGILQSISARSYAYETFRWRSNLGYHRESPRPLSNHQYEIRYHSVTSKRISESPDWWSQKMPLAFGRSPSWAAPSQSSNIETHNEMIYQTNNARNRSVGVSPIWIMVGYGMCINASCGDN